MSKKEKKINKKNKKKKKMSKSKKIIILLILLIILIVVGFFGYDFYKKVKANGGGMQGVLATIVGHDENTLKNLNEFRVLILGISTDIEAELTDTIMIASYDPKSQSASLLSIPRDTFIGNSKKNVTASDRINAVYNRKGIDGLLKEVNELTGLGIDYYLIVDTEALVKLVDTIGGVEFNVPRNMYYNDKSQNLHINLKKGMQRLNGDQAEQLVRFRKNDDGTGYSYEYGKDDFGRMRTQREFLSAVASQTLQAKNITKIFDLIDIAYEYIETNISIDVMKDYVPYAVNFDTSKLVMNQLPGASDPWTTKNGKTIWVYVHNEEKMQEMLKEMFEYNNDSTTTEETNLSDIKIEVLNGSGNNSNLTEVVKILKEAGFTVSKQSTTSKTAKTTIINKGGCDDSITKTLVTLLDGGTTSKSSSSSNSVDYTIIIGEDY